MHHDDALATLIVFLGFLAILSVGAATMSRDALRVELMTACLNDGQIVLKDVTFKCEAQK